MLYSPSTGTMPDGRLEILIQESNFELEERIVMCVEVKTKKKSLTGKNIIIGFRRCVEAFFKFAGRVFFSKYREERRCASYRFMSPGQAAVMSCTTKLPDSKVAIEGAISKFNLFK